MRPGLVDFFGNFFCNTLHFSLELFPRVGVGREVAGDAGKVVEHEALGQAGHDDAQPVADLKFPVGHVTRPEEAVLGICVQMNGRIQFTR